MRALVLALTLLILGSPAFATAASSPGGTSALGSNGCELVELYPGYPGYIGYVTGVDGIGDVACLEDLERQDRSFDRDAVDRANRKAARSLGINGGPELWTWENWMAVEAEQGLPLTCYTCLYDPNNIRPEPVNHNIRRDDPRLLAGAFQSTEVWNSLRGRYQVGQQGEAYDDYFLRVIAYASNPGRYLNAEELVETYDTLFTNMFTPGAGWIDGEQLWCNSLYQGGYAPTPSTATAQDQYWLMYSSMVTFRTETAAGSNPIFAEVTRASNLFSLPDEWLSAFSAGQTNLSLAQYIAAYGDFGVGSC